MSDFRGTCVNCQRQWIAPMPGQVRCDCGMGVFVDTPVQVPQVAGTSTVQTTSGLYVPTTSPALTWTANTQVWKGTGFTGVEPKVPDYSWTKKRSEQTEPIRAQKRAKLVVDEGKLVFGGVGAGYRYGLDATAEHGGWGTRAEHPAPDPTGKCQTCGFWANNEGRQFPGLGELVLDVELFGTVVKHTHGWRASRQRVLGARFQRECPCGAEAEGVAHMDEEYYPMCSRCVPLGLVSLADVAGALGVGVQWLAE